jgi:hypothetical protein
VAAARLRAHTRAILSRVNWWRLCQAKAERGPPVVRKRDSESGDLQRQFPKRIAASKQQLAASRAAPGSWFLNG